MTSNEIRQRIQDVAIAAHLSVPAGTIDVGVIGRAAAREALNVMQEQITAKLTPTLNTGSALDGLVLVGETFRELLAALTEQEQTDDGAALLPADPSASPAPTEALPIILPDGSASDPIPKFAFAHDPDGFLFPRTLTIGSGNPATQEPASSPHRSAAPADAPALTVEQPSNEVQRLRLELIDSTPTPSTMTLLEWVNMLDALIAAVSREQAQRIAELENDRGYWEGRARSSEVDLKSQLLKAEVQLNEQAQEITRLRAQIGEHTP